MQQTGGQGAGIHTHIDQNFGNGDGVEHVGFAALPLLVAMGIAGDRVGAQE